jgi:death-on-curing family protein
MNEIVIYQTADNQTEIDIQIDGNTIWANQKQIAEVFGTEVPAINKHIKNILNTNELDVNSTVSKMEIVQKEGNREVKRTVEIYNLDMIISVGYRVNSSRATQFRIWATQRLKDYLVKGYAINQKRLDELRQTIQLITQNTDSDELKLSEAKGLLTVIENYTKSFVLLNQFDSSDLQLNKLSGNITYEIDYQEALQAIQLLKEKLIAKKEATELFGNQKDKTFEGILRSVVQTFDSQYLYPTIEEQAAHLLYFIIKNHPFSDGNKRIGAFMFVWFLEKNKHLVKTNGEIKINDNALTALALLVAQSNPNDKDLMTRLVCNLITDM